MTTTNNKVSETGRWLIAIGSLLAMNLAVADMPTAEEVLSRLGVPQEQLGELDQGKAITYPLTESTDKELADGLAIYIPAPLAKVIAYVKRGDFAGIDSTITAQATIPENARADAFKRFALTGDEAQNLLEVKAGDQFNLSAEEIASFAALRETLQSTDKKAVAQAVSQRYREILLQRYQAYRKGGLAGIAPYTRGGSEKAAPTAELRTATSQSNAIFGNYFPDLYQTWINYPQALPAGVTERFSWANRVVEDRPTATLTHRLVQASDTGAVVVMRQFYVGHSYNSSQTVAGCLPYRDGAIVFYALRSSTDQVAGIGSGMKHSIGRSRMKDEMLKQLQRMRATLKGS